MWKNICKLLQITIVVVVLVTAGIMPVYAQNGYEISNETLSPPEPPSGPTPLELPPELLIDPPEIEAGFDIEVSESQLLTEDGISLSCPADNITVPAGVSLVIPSDCNVNLAYNYGYIRNYGTVERAYNFSGGYFDNEGDVVIFLANYANAFANNDGLISGNVYNYGTFENGVIFGTVSGNIGNYGYTLTAGVVSGNFVNYGTTENEGTTNGYIYNYKTFRNYGTIEGILNYSGGYFDNEGTVSNYLTNYANGFANNDGLVSAFVYNYGTFENGSTFGFVSGNFNNYGITENSGSVSATVRNMANATFYNFGTVTGYIYNNADANLINYGTFWKLNNLSGSAFTNSGIVSSTIMNWGAVENSGTVNNMHNWPDASFTNSGEVKYSWNYSTFTNFGAISNYIVNHLGGTIDNYGSITTLNNSGIVDNHCSATIGTIAQNDGTINDLCPLETIELLIQDIQELNIDYGIENSLDSKLSTALKALEDINAHNDVGAVNSLNSFVNAVSAQSGKKISEIDAELLILTAGEIITMLTD
jgi:hypothetical protein